MAHRIGIFDQEYAIEEYPVRFLGSGDKIGTCEFDGDPDIPFFGHDTDSCEPGTETPCFVKIDIQRSHDCGTAEFIQMEFFIRGDFLSLQRDTAALFCF